MLFLFGLLASVIHCPCLGQTGLLHASDPRDIIIGGLFPIHNHRERSMAHGALNCSMYDVQMFLNTQVMVYSIGEINQRSPRLLPGLTLGYDMYDTCADVSLAVRATLELLKSPSAPWSCAVSDKQQTKAVIGEAYSEISIAVARIFALSSVAQISYSSTSEVLSRKLKFPTFLRTISSDAFQTKAIGELVKEFDWRTVAIIGSDDEYGRFGTDRLVDVFGEMGDVCVEFVDILPGSFSQNDCETRKRLRRLVSNIGNSSAEALILFTKDSNVHIIIEEAIKRQLNRTWVASDTWSTSTKISALPGMERAGEVFGFISKRNEVPGFKDHVRSKFNGTTNNFINHFMTQYQNCSNQTDEFRQSHCRESNCFFGSKPTLDFDCLANNVNQDFSYNIYLAVQVIVEGLRQLLKCNSHTCERGTNFTAFELFTEIKRVNFTVDNTNLFFDPNGDPYLGYDIVYWNMTESKRIHIQSIGEYWPDGKIKLPGYQKMRVNVTVYNCSKACEPGHELKKHSTGCCKHCFQCADGGFLDHGGQCEHCKDSEYSSPQRDKCLKKTKVFLDWSDPFVIILSFLEVLGVIVTLMSAIVFAIHHRTPIVKSVGGYLCFLELLSLLLCFCITFCFLGKPTPVSCMIGMPVFGIAFSLCISCILANMLQILVGFNFEVGSRSWIKKLNQPLALVTIIPGIQLGLCLGWLYLSRPVLKEEILMKTILLQCIKGSDKCFIAMLSYNALLAIICFMFAYKGKQLPDLYKNASLINTSMILYLIIWILFIPIHISLYGKYKRAIEAAAIIVSSYSILGFHLAPKCYIILFRKEMNNERAITDYIKNHYEMKNMAVVQR